MVEPEEGFRYGRNEAPGGISPRWGMKANGNSIGRITELITSCLGEDRTDLPDRLALELQASLGSLKHGAEPDEELNLADLIVPRRCRAGPKSRSTTRAPPIQACG
jgi:hypothetical protein